MQLVKSFLQRIFPKMVWITPQQWRKHVSSQYVQLSDGDLLLEAEKMGHSLDTARKNYSRTSLFFCQHYAVHADDEDVRKLLSLKTLLGYVKQKATDLLKWEQQFGVVLHRIDEVLTELFDTYLALGERIVTIQDEVGDPTGSIL